MRKSSLQMSPAETLIVFLKVQTKDRSVSEDGGQHGYSCIPLKIYTDQIYVWRV